MFAEGGITVGLCDLSPSFEDCTKVFKVTPPNVIPMESTISPSKYRAKQKKKWAKKARLRRGSNNKKH